MKLFKIIFYVLLIFSTILFIYMLFNSIIYEWVYYPDGNDILEHVRIYLKSISPLWFLIKELNSLITFFCISVISIIMFVIGEKKRYFEQYSLKKYLLLIPFSYEFLALIMIAIALDNP
ncbi:hypothetical protein MASR2M18_21260 [Ignavibacteria bacterium]|nr:hypothetical protein [Ignavibacteriaceae bacterium]